MNEKHCVSLELSKELKKVGYPQEGEFWWKEGIVITNDSCLSSGEFSLVDKSIKNKCPTDIVYVSPLASELMEKLPPDILYRKKWYKLIIKKTPKNTLFIVGYETDYYFLKNFGEQNLCNALAKIYIYLSEKGLLKKE